MSARALLDAGKIDDMDGEWSEGMAREHLKHVRQGYVDLVEKVREDGSLDLLTIGSYLPWLELRIRREVGADEVTPDLSDTSFRDRLIMDQSQKGISPSDLSRAPVSDNIQEQNRRLGRPLSFLA